MANKIEPVGKVVEDYVYYPVLIGTSVTFAKGDLLWWDQANSTIKNAAAFTWDTDEPTTRRKFAAMFAGIAGEAHFADSKAGVKKVIRACEAIATLTSCTPTPGALVGPEKQSGNLLENKKLQLVVDPVEAIGEFSKLQAGSSTEGLVRLGSRLGCRNPIGARESRVICLGDVSCAGTVDVITAMAAHSLFGGGAELLELISITRATHAAADAIMNFEKGTTDLADHTVATSGSAVGTVTATSLAADANRFFEPNDTISLEVSQASTAGVETVLLRYRPMNV